MLFLTQSVDHVDNENKLFRDINSGAKKKKIKLSVKNKIMEFINVKKRRILTHIFNMRNSWSINKAT